MSKLSDLMDMKQGIRNEPDPADCSEVFPFLKDKFFDYRGSVNHNPGVAGKVEVKLRMQEPEPDPIKEPEKNIWSEYTEPVKVEPKKKPVNLVHFITYYERAKMERQQLVDNPVENPYHIDWHKVRLLKEKGSLIFETL